ncbi:hypothetical protein [Cellulosilyticum sp. I15G10I2]|uniref:hypothetical protein n=1 Tax=Cellulosilyticum sp. I15G10I2 TaxID=1892843 RepID=UPI00085C2B5F|nr:hypothetical protein [Cellulosilyticum sp. I15G10I2]
MELKNIPIETISKCNAVGDIVPLRIRLEDETHRLVTADIVQVIYAAEKNFAGLKTFDYGCKVVIDQREQLLELRYYVVSHKWIIRKVLY